jgi:Sec7 domain
MGDTLPPTPPQPQPQTPTPTPNPNPNPPVPSPLHTGMAKLQEAGLVGSSEGEVARWLLESAPRLDKRALGEYFGHHEPFQVGVMHRFIAAQDLGGLTLDEGLRRLVLQFR